MEAAIAGRSRYRVVPHSVLVGAGFTEKQIRGRVEDGRLVRLHPGVYAVGPEPLDDGGRFRAAVLAGGSGALLAGRAACAWWGVVGAAPETVDILAPAHRRNRPGVRFRRAAIEPDEATVHRGIPVVCPALAILDLAGETAGRELERALNEARVLRLPSRPSLGGPIRRYPGRRGTVAAREALALFEAGPTPTRSPGEERVLAVIDRHGLPRPLANHPVATGDGTFLVDFAWPELRVASNSMPGRRTRPPGRWQPTGDATGRSASPAGIRVGSSSTIWKTPEGSRLTSACCWRPPSAPPAG